MKIPKSQVDQLLENAQDVSQLMRRWQQGLELLQTQRAQVAAQQALLTERRAQVQRHLEEAEEVRRELEQNFLVNQGPVPVVASVVPRSPEKLDIFLLVLLGSLLVAKKSRDRVF